MDALMSLAQACTQEFERVIAAPTDVLGCKRSFEQMTLKDDAKGKKVPKEFKPHVNEKGVPAKLFRSYYEAPADKRSLAVAMACNVIAALNDVEEPDFLDKSLAVLEKMPPLAAYTWMRGNSKQHKVIVLSYGQADNFVVDWNKKCKTLYPFWCFHGSITKFHYAGHTMYFISKVEDGQHKYHFVAGKGDLFIKTARAGFQDTTARAMNHMTREIDGIGASSTAQSNYFRLSNKAEFLRDAWAGGDAAIRTRVLAAMGTIDLPPVIVAAQTKLLDELIPK